MLGEVIAWRNLFWALTDAMAANPTPWVGGAVLPNVQSGSSYRVFAGDAYGRVKEIVEKIIASALIYLPSSAKDFKNPEIDKYLAKYVRGSHGIGYKERIKVMKLLWDAIGTEFGGRHELYEMNYAGNHEDIRIQAMWNARTSGTLDGMIALADQCLCRLRRERLARSRLARSGRCGLSWLVLGSSARRSERTMSWIDQRPDDAMDGAFTVGRPGAVRTVEPAAFREAMSRLGAAVHVITTAARAARPARPRPRCARSRTRRRRADVPQPPQPDQSGGGGERRVLRQHAGRGRRRDRRRVRRTQRRDRQRPIRDR